MCALTGLLAAAVVNQLTRCQHHQRQSLQRCSWRHSKGTVSTRPRAWAHCAGSRLQEKIQRPQTHKNLQRPRSGLTQLKSCTGLGSGCLLVGMPVSTLPSSSRLQIYKPNTQPVQMIDTIRGAPARVAAAPCHTHTACRPVTTDDPTAPTPTSCRLHDPRTSCVSAHKTAQPTVLSYTQCTLHTAAQAFLLKKPDSRPLRLLFGRAFQASAPFMSATMTATLSVV